jgi:hypothetical protein
VSKKSGVVHINKIAAAGRQLDAAIRMYFIEEDELAVHTVASAAFRVLRDITAKRGRSFTADVLRNGVYVLAKRYGEGSLSERELKLIENTPVMDALRKTSEQIERLGDKFDPSVIDVTMGTNGEQRAWPSKASDFLKHADRDADDLLPIASVHNENILIGACIAYLQLMQDATPEMMAYMAYWGARNEAEYDLPNEGRELATILRTATEDQRATLCLAFIKERRRTCKL